MQSDTDTGILTLGASVASESRSASRTITWSRVALAGVILLAAGVRFWALDFGLPHTQARPDETFSIDVALNVLRGRYWPPFYDYPRLYAYCLTLLFLGYYAWGALMGQFKTIADLVASWPTNWAPFFLITRTLSAVAGVITVALIYDLGRRLAGRVTGLVAALFLGLAFMHVRDSHFGTTDVMMTLLAVGSVSLLLRSDESGARRHDVLAAVTAGLATATKYTAVFLLVPLGLSQLLHAAGKERFRLRRLFDSRGAVLATCFLLAFAIGVPFVIFDFDRFSFAVRELYVVTLHNPPRPDQPNGWWYHLSCSLRYGVGLPVLGFGLGGWIVLAVRNWRRALLLLSFPLSCYAVAGSAGLLYNRYVLPMVPFLCIGAAVGVLETARLVTRQRPSLRPLVGCLLAAAVIVPSAWSIVRFNRLIGEVDNRVLVSQWMRTHIPPGSSVVQSGSKYGHAQLWPGHRLRPWTWYERRFVLEGLRPARGRPDWILLQQSPLPSQNQKVVLDWLKTDYRLVTVFQAFDPDVSGNVYDLHDMFYVPLAGFVGVSRPGSNFCIYRRTDAPANAAAASQ